MGNDSNILDCVIWKRLPVELIRAIVILSDPSIDTRLYFKIHPKRIDETRSWRLWYLLKSHDGLVYNLETKTLHNFRIIGQHIIRRPIDFNRVDQWMNVLNEIEQPHSLEIYYENGDYTLTCSSISFYTELRVLLKGSGIARCINVMTGHTF
jgi:hypothetical protein